MLLAQPAAGGAEKVLFVGGAVEQLDKDDPLAVYDGRVPGRLYVVAAGNGEKIGECALPSVPVWDGLAAAGGRLFVAQTDGKLTCLKGDR
jgi:outer membrane protein assembly factor BamB